MVQVNNLQSEVKRLEDLWAGEFGNAYIERNISAGNGREQFWNMIVTAYSIERVLEVGCNVGVNLRLISKLISPTAVYGVDINERALELLRSSLPTINTIWSPARELPFRDKWFDLVFTVGVLIHQPESALPIVMSEIVRCSRRHVLCVEYFAEETMEVPYRGQQHALFKRNYGQIYQDMFPHLKLLDQGTLNREHGWDDLTFWLLEETR